MSVAVLLINLASSALGKFVSVFLLSLLSKYTEQTVRCLGETLIAAHATRISSSTGLHGHESRVDFLIETSDANSPAVSDCLSPVPAFAEFMK